MNGEAVYLDSSAFVKLFLPEPDSGALTRYLASRPLRVSALLLRTEVLRAAVRATLSPQRMMLVRALLDGLVYIGADVTLADDGGLMSPPELRSLDAIHLASARTIGTRLEAFVTYDQRLAGAAAWYRLPVFWPTSCKCCRCTAKDLAALCLEQLTGEGQYRETWETMLRSRGDPSR